MSVPRNQRVKTSLYRHHFTLTLNNQGELNHRGSAQTSSVVVSMGLRGNQPPFSSLWLCHWQNLCFLGILIAPILDLLYKLRINVSQRMKATDLNGPLTFPVVHPWAWYYTISMVPKKDMQWTSSAFPLAPQGDHIFTFHKIWCRHWWCPDLSSSTFF